VELLDIEIFSLRRIVKQEKGVSGARRDRHASQERSF
jgi:hypothetical protein